MRGVFLQHLAKKFFGTAPVVGHEIIGRGLDAKMVGLALPRPRIGNARIGILLEIHEDIAVGIPCPRVMRLLLEHHPRLRPRVGQRATGTQGPGKIHPGGGKILDLAHHRLEGASTLIRSPQIQLRDAEEPAGIHVMGIIREQCL